MHQKKKKNIDPSVQNFIIAVMCSSLNTSGKGPFSKLEGVGLSDKRPCTDYIHLFLNNNKNMWHMSGDRWHVTGGEHCVKFKAL